MSEEAAQAFFYAFGGDGPKANDEPFLSGGDGAVVGEWLHRYVCLARACEPTLEVDIPSGL